MIELWEIGCGLRDLHARTKVTGLKGSEEYYSSRSRKVRQVLKFVALVLTVASVATEFFL